ncbi:MAG: glycosyltransferase [Acidobacteriota bacterium]
MRGTSPTETTDGRILLFSMRNLTRHVSRCPGYEFEDVISGCESVDVIAPRRPEDSASRIGRSLTTILRRQAPRVDGPIRIGREYDLFFAFCANPRDLRYLALVEGLHDRCRRTVCVIEELWPGQISAHRRDLEILRKFDCIFSTLESSVAAIQAATGRPCHYLPLGIDTVLFSPYPSNPVRHIDVYNIGRRHPTMHERLLSQGERGEMFYVYDTTTDFSVIDPHEHRVLLANQIKRSRYFVAYPPKFESLAETGGQHEVGSRLFEGAAGGAVMLGLAPSCAAYDRSFDWPDAVVPTPTNGAKIAAVIAELESAPVRVAQIRRNNVVNSLRRHDWVYRWKQVAERVGLSPSAQVAARQQRLERMALSIAGDGLEDFFPLCEDVPEYSATG